ncbi:MAG: polysaccharide biosynthesis protein [Clostridia bacterium]|nr:polysaccharide biosynthesis protein [Clostridia bacterium]
MKNNAFLKGAILLIICNLIGKVFGAVYRIPLAKILGPVGMGMYQLVFPIYCLILTISTSGMPVAISKLVAENNSRHNFSSSKKIFKISILFLTLASFLGAVIVVFSAKLISNIQGNQSIFICYYGIAPAILFVGVLSAFRGYFQGNLLMFPTAISSLVENIIKMVMGLMLAGRFLEFGIEYAVLGALLGVSASEFVASIFLWVCYLFFKGRKLKNESQINESFKYLSKQIMNLAVPVTLGSLIAPMTSMVDSLLAINLLMVTGFSSKRATTLLGLQSGVVEPLINIPVIIAVSIAMVILPNISKFNAENNQEKIKNYAEKSLQMALCISAACAICFVIFGRQILNFLYGSTFDNDELLISTKLLFFGSFNIIFLSLVQVTASILQGLGKSKIPVKSLLIGCAIKIVFDLAFIPVRKINIFGTIISGAACYLTVFILNYKKVKEYTGLEFKTSLFYISIQECFICLFAFVSNFLCSLVMSEFVSMVIAGSVAIAVFLGTYYVFFMYDKTGYNFKEKPFK